MDIGARAKARQVRLAIAVLAATAAFAHPASAAENGIGVYPLGLRSSMSGLVAPPGVYFQNDLYFYRGSANASVALPFHSDLVADVRATSWISLPTLLWSTPVAILGGNLALSMTLPVGGPSIDAGLGLTSPLLSSAVVRNAHDSIATIGDPFVTAAIGWHSGSLHWTTGVGVNVPVGDYRDKALANLAFHHWATDLYGGVTWFDPAVGIELSGSLGVTFNSINTATDYRTGTELHLDVAALKYFAGGWSVGVVGYHYNQLTGDSGDGARLGDFKGRVTALGGTLGYTFNVDGRPISTRIKVFREFDAHNRLEGTAAYFTVALPLYVQPMGRPGVASQPTK
jgi:hypothetical protein